MEKRSRTELNFVNELIKIFGSDKQKIKAYAFDISKTVDERNYIISRLDKVDKDERIFLQTKLEYIQSSLDKINLKIQELNR